MILWYSMVQFLLGFLKYALPYPCHSICDIDFIPLSQHFLHKVPRAIFLARAKKNGSG